MDTGHSAPAPAVPIETPFGRFRDAEALHAYAVAEGKKVLDRHGCKTFAEFDELKRIREIRDAAIRSAWGALDAETIEKLKQVASGCPGGQIVIRIDAESFGIVLKDTTPGLEKIRQLGGAFHGDTRI